MHQYLLKQSAAYRAAMASKDAAKNNQPCTAQCDTGGPDTIPVVVHVISTGGLLGMPDNPADASIEAMINSLNKYFDASYQDGYGLNQSVGINSKIVFQLAKRTIDCQPTNGINRVNAAGNATYLQYGIGFAGYPGISQQELSNMAYWDNTRYFNIWLVNKVANGAYSGFGYFPTGAYSISDGIVIQYNIGGSEIMAHETGHYLDLYHTFNGSANGVCAINSNCEYYGDRVCDTDPILQNTNGCNPAATNPCTGTAYGNAIYNYMSYSCNVIFTPGQVARMRKSLYQYRYSLIRSGGHLPPPCNALPVSMSAVSATGKCGTVTLRWQTFTETNNKGFDIEYSTNGNHFNTIGFVAGKQNSTSPVHYSFTAASLVNGASFFRLRQVNLDGSSAVSGIISYTNNCYPSLKIYPNPVHDQLVVEGGSNNSITIFNAKGIIMKQVKVLTTGSIDVSGLAAGIYFITDGITRTSFIKTP